jgi:hypothetical protein
MTFCGHRVFLLPWQNTYKIHCKCLLQNACKLKNMCYNKMCQKSKRDIPLSVSFRKHYKPLNSKI